MDETNRRFVSYTRFSSLGQEGNDSVKRQMEAALAYANKHGKELAQIQDLAVSAFRGKNLRSGNLGKWIESIKAREIDASQIRFIIEDIDRFSRLEPIEAFRSFVDLVHGYDLEICVLNQNEKVYSRELLKSEPNQIFLLSATMIRANEESQTKSKRIKEIYQRRYKALREQGAKLMGSRPSWLGAKDGGFILNEHAESVKTIFDLYLNGTSTTRIALRLNDQGIVPPSKKTSKFTAAVVNHYLHQKSVYGVFEHQGHTYDDYFPVIVAKEDFDRVQLRLKKNLKKKIGRTPKASRYNMFLGLLVCECCNSPMHYRHEEKTVKGKKYVYKRWVCSRKAELNCENEYLPCDDFVPMFFEYMNQVDLNDVFNDSGTSRRDQIVLQIEKLESVINESEIEMNRIKDFIIKGLGEDDFVDEMNARKQAISESKSQIDELEEELRGISIRDVVFDMSEIDLEKISDEQKVEINRKLSMFIDKIFVRSSSAKRSVYNFSVVVRYKNGRDYELRYYPQGDGIRLESTSEGIVEKRFKFDVVERTEESRQRLLDMLLEQSEES